MVLDEAFGATVFPEHEFVRGMLLSARFMGGEPLWAHGVWTEEDGVNYRGHEVCIAVEGGDVGYGRRGICRKSDVEIIACL